MSAVACETESIMSNEHNNHDLLVQTVKEIAVLTEKIENLTNEIKTLHERVNKRESENDKVLSLVNAQSERIGNMETAFKIVWGVVVIYGGIIGIPFVVEVWKMMKGG